MRSIYDNNYDPGDYGIIIAPRLFEGMGFMPCKI